MVLNAIFERRSECQSQSSIFKVCMDLNSEVNFDPTARYSRRMFSNTEVIGWLVVLGLTAL